MTFHEFQFTLMHTFICQLVDQHTLCAKTRASLPRQEVSAQKLPEFNIL